MSELRFDGRTAVVTGAGGNPSLGRAMARTDKGILRHDDSDPREWHIKPYVPVA